MLKGYTLVAPATMRDDTREKNSNKRTIFWLSQMRSGFKLVIEWIQTAQHREREPVSNSTQALAALQSCLCFRSFFFSFFLFLSRGKKPSPSNFIFNFKKQMLLQQSVNNDYLFFFFFLFPGAQKIISLTCNCVFFSPRFLGIWSHRKQLV